jgi:hypothetical protein
MSGLPTGEAHEREIRWVEEGQRMLGALLEVVRDQNRLLGAAETAERECERLREEVSRLRAENERFRREREEIGRALSKLMNEVLPHSQPPEHGNRPPENSQRRGRITYILRQTQPGVTELVEVKR